MSKNIENGKNFVTGCQNHKKEENNMNEKKCKSAEPKPDSFRVWDEREGYSKFANLAEMEDKEAFFVLLIRNEELRNNKSIKELKEMATKYAKECFDAEKAAKDKTSGRVAEALKQRGFNPIYERSARMNEKEIKDFMKCVRKSEWFQYIDQTAEEIEQMLMKHRSSESVDSIIARAIEESERYEASCFCMADILGG